MDSVFDVYEEFDKIILFNYSPERICLMENAADRMFEDLDWETADSLEWDSRDMSVEDVYDEIYNQEDEENWDFPEPPEFLR